MTVRPLSAQPESVLPLDPPSQGKQPFHKGDELEIQGDASVPFTGAMRVAVLDATNWPWVFVKSVQGEMWLNFNHVVTAKNIGTAR